MIIEFGDLGLEPGIVSITVRFQIFKLFCIVPLFHTWKMSPEICNVLQSLGQLHFLDDDAFHYSENCAMFIAGYGSFHDAAVGFAATFAQVDALSAFGTT